MGAINDENDGVGRIRGSSNGLDDRDEEDEDKEARNRPHLRPRWSFYGSTLTVETHVRIVTLQYRVTQKNGENLLLTEL